jgi:hypothetical protein
MSPAEIPPSDMSQAVVTGSIQARSIHTSSDLAELITRLTSDTRCERLFQQLAIDPSLLNGITPTATVTTEAPVATAPKRYSRKMLAQALNMLLFEDLLQRVPEGRLYTEEKVARQQKVWLDHGALRTVAQADLAIPAGHLAFARILEPLGYRMAGTYPLDKLNMCGFVYCHADFPETISQFFVSELYPDRFSPRFQEAVSRVLASTHDPLSAADKTLLQTLTTQGSLALREACQLLPSLVACFHRQHDEPGLTDYQQLLEESKEMAWIATEGNAFNHATDRVDDIDAVEAQQKRLGRPMKPEIEIGKHAAIKQTAYRATSVERMFHNTDGTQYRLPVPGSFFEFIQRGTIRNPQTGKDRLDLRFDSANAQGIFSMTRTTR